MHVFIINYHCGQSLLFLFGIIGGSFVQPMHVISLAFFCVNFLFLTQNIYSSDIEYCKTQIGNDFAAGLSRKFIRDIKLVNDGPEIHSIVIPVLPIGSH